MRDRKSLYDRLRVNNLTFSWLVEALNSKGLNVSKSEMSSITRGTVIGNKANLVVEKSHIILDRYEEFISSVVV